MKLISKFFLIAMPAVLIMAGCHAASGEANQPRVKTGLEVLVDRDFDVLQDKRVGLITNATGVDHNLVSVVDIFYQSEQVNLVALFGPEHGVRGDYDAGAYVESYIDEQTAIPVYSLYGPTRKPTPEMLEGIDILVYDIQDIGVRSYTYISTMGITMEAAAEQGIEYVVLDRPNPLSGNRVEGNVAEEGFFSFVSQYPIPYVHGLTVAELAVLLNEEGMLDGGVQADLTVVPMENWQRDMTFDDTGLSWVPTSPHIPHSWSPVFYVATGKFGELKILSEGVGYTLPFEFFGAEWIDADQLAANLNARDFPGVVFRPVSWRPFYGRDEGKRLQGVQIHVTDYSQLNLTALGYRFLEAHHELYPERNPFKMATDARIRMFDRVAGSDQVRRLFTENMRYEDVKDFLDKDVVPFRELSQNYWLYQ
ncbi:MAG: exo-beta-N-acetylmuramidase NamZ family protein [Bacteroidota bacterium]